LLTPQALNRQLHGGAIKRLIYGKPFGLRLGKIVIPSRYECEHFLISGNSGSGKTTTIRVMLRQIAERQQAAIILDREGEFTQEFFSEKRGDWILNPLDVRCPAWSAWSELRDESFTVDAAAMAASLIRGRPKDDGQRFFLESTRTVVEAILHVARNDPDPDSLLNLVSLPRPELHAILSGYPAYGLVDPDAHDQGAGIIGTAVNAVKTFVYLPKREQASREWSARQWTQERRGWIFLPSREDIDEAVRTIEALWLDCLIRWLMTPDVGSQIGSQQTWIIADELASLGFSPQIEKLLTRGRKRSIAAVLGLQNVSQLRDIYGPEGCVTITSSPSTKLILRVDETQTARWASEQIDGHEIDRMTMTQLAGRSSYREGINLSEQRTTEPLVLPSEIKLLKPFTGYLCLAGEHRTTVTIPELHLVRRQPAYIPRPAALPAKAQAPAAQPDEQEIAAQILQRGPQPAED
jgi:type IV secretory pathway TraG/TraD family ATPase VirD4